MDFIKKINELKQRYWRGEKRKLQKTAPPPQEIYQPLRETYSPPPPPERVENCLSIRSRDEFDEYFGRLNDISDFNEFSREQWIRTYLDRVGKTLNEISAMSDFDDEEFNFKLAGKVRKITEQLLIIFSDAKKATNLDENFRQKLMKTVEDYLDKIGVGKKNFRRGDAFSDWANLGMTDSHGIISTRDRSLDSKISSVEVQPRVIRYLDDMGGVSELTFGGYCKFYKFAEG